jgi:DNA helicase MCM9
LQTRCSVIAATNPKGKFDPSQTISVNVAIGGPLLSRFDIVMLLLDQNDEGWDKTVSSFILSGRHREGADKAEWTCEKLQAYISFIRTTFRPQLTPESKRVLSAYYQKQRASDVKDSARTTVRMLESLIRLAQAHAKLMMRPKVSQQDAIMAVIMMEASMYTSALDGVSSAVRTMFPANPDDECALLVGGTMIGITQHNAI